jgi:hypothetical protein
MCTCFSCKYVALIKARISDMWLSDLMNFRLHYCSALVQLQYMKLVPFAFGSGCRSCVRTRDDRSIFGLETMR